MPDAYHVAGSYHVDGDEVTVQVRLNPVDKLGVTFDEKGKTGAAGKAIGLPEKIEQEIESRLAAAKIGP